MANSLFAGQSRQVFPESTGRVLVNSTIGLFGLIDVASSMGMPKPDEDFGQTLVTGGGDRPYLGTAAAGAVQPARRRRPGARFHAAGL